MREIIFALREDDGTAYISDIAKKIKTTNENVQHCVARLMRRGRVVKLREAYENRVQIVLVDQWERKKCQMRIEHKN